jgi:hypothetical protein
VFADIKRPLTQTSVALQMMSNCLAAVSDLNLAIVGCKSVDKLKTNLGAFFLGFAFVLAIFASDITAPGHALGQSTAFLFDRIGTE